MLTKRSFTIQGHRTSIALEPQFWAAFDEAKRASRYDPGARPSLSRIRDVLEAGR